MSGMSSLVPRLLAVPLRVLCVLCGCLAVVVFAQEAPKVAGTDVPPPKRLRTVLPEYPLAAQESGAHGIVILEITIDSHGKVAAVKVLRSVPPFDEPAIAAVKKWEYEVTKLEGQPVAVTLTVPITFALRVPEVSRQEGIPELRQGTSPVYPKGQKGGGRVRVEVSLDPEGKLAEMEVTSGEGPFREALLQSLRSWRFAPPDAGTLVSFRVEADFEAAKRDTPDRVSVRLAGLHSETVAAAAGNPEPRPSAAPVTTAAAPAPSSPAPTAPSPSKPVAEPPTEVLTAPPPPRPAPPPPTAGSSAVDDVTLAVGVPDLTKGRRPVAPPFARMAGASGAVEVRFAVNAAGQASVLQVEGPDLLKPAAEQAVASWLFRRTTAERLYLTAVFTYKGDAAAAVVTPAPEPPAATPAAAPASPAPGASPAPPA
jgi:TonB family protein